MIYAGPLGHAVEQGRLRLLIDRKIVGEETEDEGGEEEKVCLREGLLVSLSETAEILRYLTIMANTCAMGKGGGVTRGSTGISTLFFLQVN